MPLLPASALLRGPATRGAFAALLMAAAGTVAAMGGRALLMPWIGPGLAFIFAFPAVVVCALWAGALPAVATAAMCAAWYLLPGLSPSPPASAGGGWAEAALFFVLASAMAWAVAARTGEHAGAVAGEPDAEADESTLFWLRAAVLLSLLLPWAVFTGVALYAHEAAVTGAQRRMQRLAGIAHEHALKLFETGEVLIRQASLMTQDMDGGALRRDGARLHAQLAAMTRGLGQVQSLWVLDAQGNALANSRTSEPPALNFADRPAFVQHRQGARQALVTPPRTGAVTGELFFDLSRRRTTRDGAFNGVTMVGLHPAYFTTFYRELADSEKGVVLALVHQDRHLIARWPASSVPGAAIADRSPMAGPMGRDERAGILRGISSFDGVERIGAFRKVGDYPVYVYAGTDVPAALASWRREVLALAAFILPLSVCLALISWQALRRTRRHMEDARLLRREAEERQKMEAALRQSQKLEAMGHLTGGVAHDFNNLLMVVNLNVSLLRSRLKGSHEGQLDAIERAVSAGKKLTRQLLAFSRRQPLMPRRVDLGERMPALADLIRPALGSSIALHMEVEPGTQAITVDTGELELAVLNLAVNAKDAMPDGGELRIHVRNDGGFVEIAVSDTGTGIAPEHLERVFEPFFTTKPVGAGTGLGLSQVYGLCARAGGNAVVESQPGQGTTVRLRFPASPAPATDLDDSRPGHRPLEPLALSVLMVEDNQDVAGATRELLQAAGCKVTHVAQPAGALELLAAGAPRVDIVLSDIVMPGGMDGLQLAAELQRLYPKLPLVLMTGYAEKIGEAESRQLVVLPKPFEPDLLVRTLREQAAAPR